MANKKIQTKREINPLVYETTRWQEMLFQARASGTRLSSVLGSTEQALALQGDNKSQAKSFGLETFARLYDDPQALETPEAKAPWAQDAHGVLDGLDEFNSLAALVSSDPDMAALATAQMLEALGPHLEALVKEAKERQEREENGEQEPEQELGRDGKPRVKFTAADKVRAVLRGAARDARESVADARKALDGISPGLGRAPAQHDQHDPRRLLLAEALTNSPDLRKIIELAGRLERIHSKDAQIRRTRDSYEEVMDIERGADLGRILPSQLVGLKAGGVRRLLTLKGIADRTLLQYRLEGHEPMGRGAMIVALDESSSMNWNQGGEYIPNIWARAIGLACLRMARKSRRDCTVLGFNGHITSIHLMTGSGDCYELDQQGNRSTMAGGLAELAMEVISRGCGGGTNFGPPIDYAVDAFGGEDRPDLIFVTDGEAHVPAATMERLKAAREQQGLRVYGVAMGNGSITPAMKSVCDVTVSFNLNEGPNVGAAKVLPS